MGKFREMFLNETIYVEDIEDIIDMINDVDITWSEYGPTPEKQLKAWAEEILKNYDITEISDMLDIDKKNVKPFLIFITKNSKILAKSVKL